MRDHVHLGFMALLIVLLDLERSVRTLFRRNCLECPNISPSCPQCAPDETCSMSSQSCNSCPFTSCIKIGTLPTVGSPPHKNAPIAGAVAGGVIGGVVLIIGVTFLVWRFCIRNRRREYDETEGTIDGVEKRDQFGMHRDARASTRSVGSVASTVLTRASNVIQIAYIPGVTNRSPPDTPGLLVPPVPPLPIASGTSSNVSTPRYDQDQHFFLPGDIRDSTWSGRSDNTRDSVTPSLARSSVATTIYRDNAVVNPLPAQQALRIKPAVVSVKSGTNTPLDTPRNGTPSVPSINNKYSQSSLANSSSSIVARSAAARPIQVTRTGSGRKVPTTDSPNSSLQPPKKHARKPSDIIEDNFSSSDDDDASPRRSLMGHDRPTLTQTQQQDSPATNQTAFTNNSNNPTASSSSVSQGKTSAGTASGAQHRHKKSGSLNQLIEDAMTRATREPRHGGLGGMDDGSSSESLAGSGSVVDSGGKKRDPSPFSDANEVKSS